MQAYNAFDVDERAPEEEAKGHEQVPAEEGGEGHSPELEE